MADALLALASALYLGGQAVQRPAHSLSSDPESLGQQHLGGLRAGPGNYGALATTWDTKFKTESRMFTPKAGPETRSPLEKAMYESIDARESGPARKPINQWEPLMMGIYHMVKALNAR